LFWGLETWEHNRHCSYGVKFSTDVKRIFLSGSTVSNQTGAIGSPHIAVFELDAKESKAKVTGSGAFSDLEILQKIFFYLCRYYLLLSLRDGVRIWHYKKGTKPHHHKLDL
jgi:hypothetical protein